MTNDNTDHKGEIETHIDKVMRLKEFAISQGYELSEELISTLNEQASVTPKDNINAANRSELDHACNFRA